MTGDEQQLFLIEFLVDRVNVPGVRAMHDEILPALTCVSFQVLNLPLITIHQDDPGASNCACLEEAQVFRKGKSCLFALPTVILNKELHSFPITMSVYKKLPPGVLPDVMLIGSAIIDLKDLINSLLNEEAFKSGNPCKSMKDTFKLSTATGQIVGDATVFIRTSCFGSKIITQFQMPHNKKPYLFKGTEGSPIFQCRKIPSNLPPPAAPRCTCPPKSAKEDGGGSRARRSCCSSPVPPPPPPPTPTKTWDPPGKVPFRPCCPSQQGQKCPSSPASLPRDKIPVSPGYDPSRATVRVPTGQKKCGCSKDHSQFVNKY
ncbi:uncharacterized protein LOC135166174 [Diachasmimorpha longicaudata]|uniref:uncharacterized protein LOC135166174 n=1 Tax=Diachasmimorpha longicaudata TaxID=58733 RepID=UPI0030B8E160